jgi:hypothetical protein
MDDTAARSKSPRSISVILKLTHRALDRRFPTGPIRQKSPRMDAGTFSEFGTGALRAFQLFRTADLAQNVITRAAATNDLGNHVVTAWGRLYLCWFHGFLLQSWFRLLM